MEWLRVIDANKWTMKWKETKNTRTNKFRYLNDRLQVYTSVKSQEFRVRNAFDSMTILWTIEMFNIDMPFFIIWIKKCVYLLLYIHICLDWEWRRRFENSSYSWCWASSQWRNSVHCIQFIKSRANTTIVLHRFSRSSTTCTVGECQRWSWCWLLLCQYNNCPLYRLKSEYITNYTASIQTNRRCSGLLNSRTRRLYGINWWNRLFNSHIWWLSKTIRQVATSGK